MFWCTLLWTESAPGEEVQGERIHTIPPPPPPQLSLYFIILKKIKNWFQGVKGEHRHVLDLKEKM